MSEFDLIVLVITLASFLVLLALKVHVAVSLLISGFLGIVLLRGPEAAVSTISGAPYSAAYNYSLIIVPLFILMGVFAVRAGLADAGFNAAQRLLARLPGGPALASLSGSGLFAAVTGSSVATVATMARVSTDAIVRAGYSIRLAAGVVCAGGTLGVLIPPSIVLVLYAIVTEEPIGALLIAGIAPGLLTIAVYAITIMIIGSMEQRKPTPVQPALGATRRSTAIRIDYSALLYLAALFAVSIGTMYMGIATPTEAASFGALAAVLILFLRSRRSHDMLEKSRAGLREAVGLTAMTFLLLAGAAVFTYFLALSGANAAVIESVVGADLSPLVALVLCLAFLIPMGMFLDGLSMILISAPLLHPILTGYGFDGIWLGILIVKVAEMSLITPPVGMNAFVYSGAIKETSLGTVFKGVWPFIVADVVVVAVLIMFPEIVTFLPNLSAA